MLRSLLMRLARSPLGGAVAGVLFSAMSFALPVRRLYETETLLAFHHPQPAHAVHILIVPRRRLSGLADLGPEDADFMRDLFAAVNRLVAELGLEAGGYRLVANGGAYQEVPHLHFHLLSDSVDEASAGEAPD